MGMNALRLLSNQNRLYDSLLGKTEANQGKSRQKIKVVRKTQSENGTLRGWIADPLITSLKFGVSWTSAEPRGD